MQTQVSSDTELIEESRFWSGSNTPPVTHLTAENGNPENTKCGIKNPGTRIVCHAERKRNNNKIRKNSNKADEDENVVGRIKKAGTSNRKHNRNRKRNKNKNKNKNKKNKNKFRKKTNKSDVDVKIVCGDAATKNEFPWVVGLFKKGQQKPDPFCGGSLIASRWILTAAHCLKENNGEDKPASQISVLLGGHKRNVPIDGSVMIIDVDKYFPHSEFMDTMQSLSPPRNLINDVALLKLKTEVNLATYTPVCLPPKNAFAEMYDKKTATAVGWGNLAYQGDRPDVLQKVQVKVIPLETCVDSYAGVLEIDGDSSICAGDKGKSSCNGDSGSPLTVKRGNQHNQIGITSFGNCDKCRHCNPTARGFTDVDLVEESRTFNLLFQCCPACSGTGDVSLAVNDKCGIKRAGTRKLKRGGNKKKNKNKNKKNKKKKSTDSDEDIKIVGGNEAMENEYPWIVALFPKGQQKPDPYCGGSLIASQWVLTAVHCLKEDDGTDTPKEKISVLLGEHDLSDDTDGNVMILDVEEVYLHPNYADTLDTPVGHLLADVALLKLKKKVNLATYTPVCLPPEKVVASMYDGKTATAVGWGRTATVPEPDILQEVEVTVTTLASCKASYAGTYDIKTGHICAADTGKDTCVGDSGGPLTVKTVNQHFQVGITSFGKGCAKPRYPGVYADVANYRN